MNAEKYCNDIVRKSGSNFYYSFLFLKKRKRRAMYAVYAFSRVIDDIVDSDESSSSKEKLIGFWRTEIEKCYSSGSEHPLTKELRYATREFHIPKQYLLELLLGVMQDMIQQRYVTFDDLQKYCYRVASVVGLMCLKIFEAPDSEENRKAAINLGLAFQTTNILRDIAEDADNDRIYLPIEELIRFNLTEEDIINKKYSEDFRKFMQFQWDRSESYYKKAWSGFDKIAAKKLFPALIMSDIYHEILEKIKEIDYNVFKTRIRIPNLTKIKIAFKRWM